MRLLRMASAALLVSLVPWGQALAGAPAQSFAPDAAISIDAHPLTPQNAPADEYFGRLKLSNLGIRNIIHAIAVEGDSPLALPMQRLRIMGVDTAIVQWGDLYPRDSWLGGVVLHFAGVLSGKHDADTDRIAIDLLLQESGRLHRPAYTRAALALIRSIEPAVTVDWTIVPYPMPTYADELALDPRAAGGR